MTKEELKNIATNPPFTVFNRTRMYMLPAIYDWGTAFVNNLQKFSMLAVCVNDVNNPVDKQESLYLLFNIPRSLSVQKRHKGNIFDFLHFFRKHAGYVTDYPYGHMLYDRLHMFVFRIPKEHEESYHYFCNGNYSKMYGHDALQRLFLNNVSKPGIKGESAKRAYDTITRNPKLKKELENWLSFSDDDLPLTHITLPEDVELDSYWNDPDQGDIYKREIFE